MSGKFKGLVCILLMLSSELSAAQISGVIQHDGMPVTDVDVEVWTVLGSTGFVCYGRYYLFETITVQPDGSYVVDVSPGNNYVVQVEPDAATGLLPSYYPGKDTVSDAYLIGTTEAVPATNINFELEAGAKISGIVLGDSIGIPDVWVGVYNGDHSQSSRTDSNGVFNVLARPGDNYTVTASPASDSRWRSI